MEKQKIILKTSSEFEKLKFLKNMKEFQTLIFRIIPVKGCAYYTEIFFQTCILIFVAFITTFRLRILGPSLGVCHIQNFQKRTMVKKQKKKRDENDIPPWMT